MTTPSAPLPAAARAHSTADIVATALLSTALAMGSLFAGYVSLFAFGMSTDGCFERCREEYVGDAYAAAWGGIGLALLVTLIGVVWAGTKRKPMFIWPLLGIGIVVAGFVVAFGFIDLAMGN